ncbi:MAG: RHS repeat-associated core domain-containing protein [Crenarchaeota archaeon]|nr:RHS repeat-associated core domain-containing protein [Thermoproteota archaeon]
MAIYNEKGTKIASYTYDAWGVCVSTFTSGTSSTDRIAAMINPFRYRGYYLDVETELYYLQSRYYNPNWGRFINADVYINANGDLIGFNMFAYCSNNPIMYVDYSGYDAIYISDKGTRGVPVVGHAALLIQDKHGSWYFTEFAGSTKSNAKVYFWELSDKGYQGYRDFLKTYNYPNEMGFEYIYGDYSNSFNTINEYISGQRSFGKYNLFKNNCLDYVQTILSQGEAYYSFLHWSIQEGGANSIMIPEQYLNHLKHLSPPKISRSGSSKPSNFAYMTLY